MLGMSIIKDLLENKIEEVVEHVVMEVIHATGESPLGTGLEIAERAEKFFKSGGASEVNIALGRLGLSSLRGAVNLIAHPPTARREPQWVRSGWAKSRQEWLNESWRHDWRSQPRDLKGRWIPGRLPYPVAGAPRKGTKWGVSRRGRQILARRRMKNKYRKIGRKIGRDFVASWGRDGN